MSSCMLLMLKSSCKILFVGYGRVNGWYRRRGHRSELWIVRRQLTHPGKDAKGCFMIKFDCEDKSYFMVRFNHIHGKSSLMLSNSSNVT